ncbi:hypothetical protein [Planctomicrobium sp. SH527]|uniref:hypothetical protein n=1 Tax=Planctomicrobium sp. SH527 TaxID=3448123 RepID=UPI003F5B1CE1
MTLQLNQVTIGNILTRTSGYLQTVSSHSVQPYCGCTFGRSLCGVGCYVRHNGHLLRGRSWGEFLDVRVNAAESYQTHYERERNWAHRQRGTFSLFCSSSTDPFLPQEKKWQITRSLLLAMQEQPPDELILQTHSPSVLDVIEILISLNTRCRLRVHLSIETDRDRIPGLPPPAASVQARLNTCKKLRSAGIRTVVTVAPLLPIESPHRFFEQIADVADAVVIDHFIQGDGSDDGSRTLRTQLPMKMAAVDPSSITLAYRDQMVAVAQQYLPGRVGVNIDGFAGRMLP